MSRNVLPRRRRFGASPAPVDALARGTRQLNEREVAYLRDYMEPVRIARAAKDRGMLNAIEAARPLNEDTADQAYAKAIMKEAGRLLGRLLVIAVWVVCIAYAINLWVRP